MNLENDDDDDDDDGDGFLTNRIIVLHRVIS